MIYAMNWMNVENTMLIERRQPQKTIYNSMHMKYSEETNL